MAEFNYKLEDGKYTFKGRFVGVRSINTKTLW